ncbi:zinc finger BED domain-containing protein 1 [Elysia marginata]|uniref:Zinc finger BED domain-containing protein 1 n=1 Tax=Elysia marginata TaxID=1093978 RepID=A0AAV4IBA7_9GAST|nr:zinc finger BED domain-containing protein 1 [Elysia marginata]
MEESWSLVQVKEEMVEQDVIGTEHLKEMLTVKVEMPAEEAEMHAEEADMHTEEAEMHAEEAEMQSEEAEMDSKRKAGGSNADGMVPGNKEGDKNRQCTAIAPSKMLHHTSDVWIFMEKVENGEVLCKVCGQRLTFFRCSTSNLRRHLIAKHRKEIENLKRELAERVREEEILHKKFPSNIGPRNICLRSDAWKYMYKFSDRQVMCRLCLRVLTYCSSGTSNLCRHLRKKHSLIMEQRSESPKTIGPEKMYEKLRSAWKVWEFMERIGHEHFKCKLCGTLLSRTKNNDTTHLLIHMLEMHPGSLLKNGCVDIEVAKKELKEAIFAQRSFVPPAESREVECKEQFSQDSESDVTSSPGSSHVEERFQPQPQSVQIGKFSLSNVKSDIFENTRAALFNDSSMVWNFMRKTSPSVASCRLCNRNFQRHKPTMMSHVRRQHSKELRRLRKQGLVPFLSQSMPHGRGLSRENKWRSQLGDPVTSTTCKSTKPLDLTDHVQFSQLVINLVVNDLRPCSLVESASFLKLVNTLNPRVTVPNKTKIEESLTELHFKYKDLLQMQIREAEGISISTEIWTYRTRELYMTVSAHFITDRWELKSVVLKTARLDTNIGLAGSFAESLRDILKDWDILDKVTCVVTDNRMGLAAGVSQLDKPHLPCIAYTLNQIVQDCLKLDTGDLAFLAKRIPSLPLSLLHWPEILSISITEFLERTQQQPMEVEMRRRKWRWIGHTLSLTRKQRQCITRHSLVWNPQGRRARGRPRMTWGRETEAEMASAEKTWTGENWKR